jgi:CPA1 family monovalent cation:H+ antiporter
VDFNLSTIIEGESLFNDGVAGSLYQIFLALVLFSVHGGTPWGGSIWVQSLSILFLQAGLGCLLGIICGLLISRFVKYIDEPLIETTITIVTAYGVYLLADFLHTSGILAVIITGLIIGYHGEGDAMSERTKEVVDNFWSMIAFLANALLFLLVGIQLNPLSLLAPNDAQQRLLIAAVAIVCVLLARLVMVILLPRFALEAGKRLHSWRFLIFWSGLRGALSLALVLALPLDVPNRSALIFATYAVILFTLLVQGFSLRVLLRHLSSVRR